MNFSYSFINDEGAEFGFGRVEPPNFDHVDASPLIISAAVENVETILDGRFDVASREFYNQGREGSCVGFGTSRSLTILNGKRYRARGLYLRAQNFDPFPGTNYSGTTVSAAMKVLVNEGATVATASAAETKWEPDLAEGFESVLWARSVDQARTCIANRVPFTVGVTWFPGYSALRQKNGEYWVQSGASRGSNRGAGHCVSFRAASDRRQAFGFSQSWGNTMPELIWMPYDEMEYLMERGGEIAVVVDRGAPDADYSFLD